MDLKLPEAMRLGAMVEPQVFGIRATAVGSCAVGSAMKAATGSHWGSLGSIWPWADVINPPCPACGLHPVNLGTAIVHLNDEHRWTREQIADWVATIESQQEAAQPTPELAEVCAC